MQSMNAIAWMAALLASLGIVMMASRAAVEHATRLATGLRVPPFLVGIGLMAVGTDLPEIANSIASCLAGHGDLNVGDSIGSAVTQATLILGLLPFVGGAMVVNPGRVRTVGMLTVAAIAFGALLAMDGHLGRLDGALLVASWLAALAIVLRLAPPPSEPVLPIAPGRPWRHLMLALAGLLVVGAAAAVAVLAFVQLSHIFGVPEYLASFFVAAIGTSLPELTVDISALRRGQGDLAMGDILGSSLVDATLSLGIGPLVAPVAITASLAVAGALTAMTLLAVAILVLAARRRHDRRSGVLLVLLYALLYSLLLR